VRPKIEVWLYEPDAPWPWQSGPFFPVLLNSSFLPFSPLLFVVRKITNKLYSAKEKLIFFKQKTSFSYLLIVEL
jgi:hypothetical protein